MNLTTVSRGARPTQAVTFPIIAAVVLAFLGATAAGQAAEVPAASTPVTLDAVADAYVDEAAPASNYGAYKSLFVALEGSSGYEQETLVRFNLSSIPAGSVVDKATFHAYLEYASGPSSVTLTLSRIVIGWEEKTVTWSTRPGRVARSTAAVGAATGWYAWDAAQTAKDWIENGSPNYGVVLSGPASGSSYTRRFTSREVGPAPRLEISYYPPTPTPTSTASPTATRTPTASPTATRTPTATPTVTRTTTASLTATRTQTASPTTTHTPTATPTVTRTATASLTATRTQTASPTATRTPTASPTATRTPTPSPTITRTSTATTTGLPPDTTPPKIISGPTVSSLTSSSATISWTTDEPADAVVRFGNKAGVLDRQGDDPTHALTHAIVLTGLQPSTTYAYVVRSADTAGNMVTSREAFFKTAATPGNAPSLSEFTITRVPGLRALYRLSAAVPITLKIARVDFYLDGTLMGKDYAPLPDGGLNRFEYLLAPSFVGLPDADFFRQHTIEAVALGEDGLTGRRSVLFDPPFECEEIEASVVQPLRGKTVFIQGEVVPQGKTQHIEVSARRIDPVCEYPAGDIRSAIERRNCIERHAMVAGVDIFAGGRFVCHLDGNSSHTYECDWDLGELTSGTYTVRADVTGDASCKQTVTQDLSIRQGEARLDVTRAVTRTANVFEVALTVENVGRAAYTVDRLEDSVTGFQPIAKEITDVGLAYTVAMDCLSSGTNCSLGIEVGDAADTVITLHPGGSLTVSYQVIPVLDVDPDDDDWVIGTDPVRVVGRGEQENPTFDLPCVQTTDRELLADAVRSAWGGSNYLIVTNRGVLGLLYGIDTPRGYHSLLSDMARLARYRGAMLGFVGGLDANDPDEIREVIRDWGSDMRGANMAAGGYLTDGYVLIVGDSVVVASQLIYDDDIADATSHWPGSGVSPIRLVDNYYANMTGGSKPELSVGRLPGDTTRALRRPIETSLLNQHDCSWGLVVSGFDDDAENEGDFRVGSRQIRNRLDDEFEFVRLIHWDDFPSADERLDEFLLWAPQMDAIFYQDHGSIDGWANTLHSWTVPANFQGAYPVVVALACWTGHYQAEDSIAEAFLDSEAGAYIGSTELSAIVTNVEAGPMYVERWLAGRTAAQALRQTKRALWGDDPEDVERLWVHEYNYYGDPTYAYCPDNNAAQASGLAAAPVPPVVTASPPSTLTLMIPPYEVTSEGGIDRVSIPGGGMLLIEGRPMVPTFLMTQEIPAGYRVQDVILAERSGLSTASGLVLPIVRHEPANSSVVWANQPAITASSGWYPERDFGWQVDELSDGTSTLFLRVYPFYYEAATTGVRFNSTYRFAIRYTQPAIGLADVATDKLTYAPGEPVAIHLVVKATGAAQDAVVEAVVRREASSEPIAGLLLTTLTALQGRATFSTTWDGGDPDAYYAEVTLRESGGDLIDRTTAAFTVGSSAAEISSFTATPASYTPGQPVSIHLSFANTGTVPISGAAVIEVRDLAGAVMHTFTHDFERLAVDASLDIDDLWPTAGMLASHRLFGYVTYDGRATEPAVALVRSSPRTCLPLVRRQ